MVFGCHTNTGRADLGFPLDLPYDGFTNFTIFLLNGFGSRLPGIM
jgi:hypothetical protein